MNISTDQEGVRHACSCNMHAGPLTPTLLNRSLMSLEIVSTPYAQRHIIDGTSGMERERRAICDLCKLLFTSLTLQGQLVGGSPVWCTQSELAGINRRNKEEVKPP